MPQVGSAAKAEHQGRQRKRHIYEKDADDKPVRQIASGQVSAVPNDKWGENLQETTGSVRRRGAASHRRSRAASCIRPGVPLIVALGAHRFTGVTLEDVDDTLRGLAGPKIKFQFDASDPHIGTRP